MEIYIILNLPCYLLATGNCLNVFVNWALLAQAGPLQLLETLSLRKFYIAVCGIIIFVYCILYIE